MTVAPRRTLCLVAVAVAFALASPLASAQDKAGPKPAASGPMSVNGKEIPASRLDMLVRQLQSQGQQDSPQMRAGLRQRLLMQELLAQEAVKKGLDKGPEVAAMIEIQRQELLANALMAEFARTNPVNDDAIRKEYDRQKAQAGERVYHARHILVEKEDEAKQILTQLKGGANFEKLATEKSKDPGSAARGGDLGWNPANTYVKPFSDALVKLKKGQITDPAVKTDFGFHIIRLEEDRPFPAFEELKPRLGQMVQQQAMQKFVNDLRTKAKIVE